jgi:hypothetical protein
MSLYRILGQTAKIIDLYRVNLYIGKTQVMRDEMAFVLTLQDNHKKTGK